MNEPRALEESLGGAVGVSAPVHRVEVRREQQQQRQQRPHRATDARGCAAHHSRTLSLHSLGCTSSAPEAHTRARRPHGSAGPRGSERGAILRYGGRARARSRAQPSLPRDLTPWCGATREHYTLTRYEIATQLPPARVTTLKWCDDIRIHLYPVSDTCAAFTRSQLLVTLSTWKFVQTVSKHHSDGQEIWTACLDRVLRLPCPISWQRLAFANLYWIK